MDKKQLDYFKDVLNGNLEELLAEAGKTVSGMSGGKDDKFPDPADRASLETDRNFLLRVKDRERKLILKLQEAIARINDGEYGVCEICGEDISEKRLKVRPVTTCCIECKTEEEEHENKQNSMH